MMTKDQFTETFQHRIDGWVLDAAMSHDRKGGELSFWLKMIRFQIREELGKMYDSLQPPKPLAPNAPIQIQGKK